MGSLYLTVRRPFVADHFHDLPGFVEARHGHNWEAEVTFRGAPGETEAPAGALDDWIARMDYTLLNQQASLAGRNPTAEALARDLLLHLEAEGLRVARVQVREKANYWAACRREGR
ncbi:6-pyruvoyl trahydropterin synthase family protein [Mesoterricola sediminis]|uniref:6-carboxy-5,6,7,8-tetrahydropterin synthase n=1 Tax=Mesoterricola sediminis TaxID=2927980 RepID=A0AA48GPG5_9BACT|nr:6-carboxytetrahydropterin synthase [Mesoterricola sediminis]BDU75144.1 hypothetical protein METESE_01020 [Mesoterricola sediminis]